MARDEVLHKGADVWGLLLYGGSVSCIVGRLQQHKKLWVKEAGGCGDRIDTTDILMRIRNIGVNDAHNNQIES